MSGDEAVVVLREYGWGRAPLDREAERASLVLVAERDRYRAALEKIDLHLHHVQPWATHPELRFDPDNVIALCRSCHHDEHRKGGGSDQ